MKLDIEQFKIQLLEVLIELSKAKNNKIPPRIPEEEGILDMEEMSIEDLSLQFKKRMKEYENFAKFFLSELGLKNASKVLEIGPGPAWITIVLAQENPSLKITGLEISEDMIKVARKNVKEAGIKGCIEFIQGSVSDMNEIPDNSYDAVITHDSLHHWEKPKDAFNEINRVLKENGVFCIADGRRDIGFGAKIIFKIARLFIGKQMSFWWKSSINASYTPEEVRTMLDQTALKGKYEIKMDLFDITIHNKL